VHTFPSTVAAIGIASKQSLTAFHTFSPHSSPNLLMHSLNQQHKQLETVSITNSLQNRQDGHISQILNFGGDGMGWCGGIGRKGEGELRRGERGWEEGDDKRGGNRKGKEGEGSEKREDGEERTGEEWRQEKRRKRMGGQRQKGRKV